MIKNDLQCKDNTRNSLGQNQWCREVLTFHGRGLYHIETSPLFALQINRLVPIWQGLPP